MVCKDWIDAKKVAFDCQSGLCFVCGEPLYEYVGHHVIPRSMKGPNTVENCQIRHVECEAWAHQVHPTGNPTARQVADFLQGEDYEKATQAGNS